MPQARTFADRPASATATERPPSRPRADGQLEADRSAWTITVLSDALDRSVRSPARQPQLDHLKGQPLGPVRILGERGQRPLHQRRID
jgi:hypothetical protein